LIGIGDVACPTQMSKLFESIDSTFGRLDVLVANAYTSSLWGCLSLISLRAVTCS
jgi:NAD(P)-dependent dehydrogenase (short-subunit alcohol dehydrogenase family)